MSDLTRPSRSTVRDKSARTASRSLVAPEDDLRLSRGLLTVDPRHAASEPLRQRTAQEISRLYGNRVVQRELERHSSSVPSVNRVPSGEQVIARDTDEKRSEASKASYDLGNDQDTVPTHLNGKLFDKMQASVLEYWTNYKNGLKDFQDRMELPEEEMEIRLIDHIFQAPIKVMYGEVKGALGKLNYAIGFIIKVTEELGKSPSGKSERSEAIKFLKYVEDLRGNIGTMKKSMLDGLVDMRQRFLREYSAAAVGAPNEGKPVDGIVRGEPAVKLKELREHVAAFEARMAAQTTASMWQSFNEGYVRTFSSKGSSALREIQATLHGGLIVERRSDGWSLTGVDEAWRIIAPMPHRKNAARSLEAALRKQGKKPIDADLAKRVEIVVDKDEVGVITFTKSMGDYSAKGYGGNRATVEELWNVPMFRNRVRDVAAIRWSSTLARKANGEAFYD